MRLSTPLLLAAACCPLAHAQDFDLRAAPFNALRWSKSDAEQAEVRLADEWFGWSAIDELEVSELIAFCKQEWPRKWRKRLGEDLVEALVLMEHPLQSTVKLTLIDLHSGATLTRDEVAMTEDNRRAILAYNSGATERITNARPVIGRPAPALVGTDLDGLPWSLAELRGKTVLIDFWATWCAPCIAELPALGKAHDLWAERGLVILAVSIDAPSAGPAVRELVAQRKLPWTVLFDDKAGNAGLQAAWRVEEIPQCFLIDEHGVLRAAGLRGAQVEASVGLLIEHGTLDKHELSARAEPQRDADDELPKLSPFHAVRVNGEAYEVQLDEVWYRLVSLDGASARELREHCDAQYGEKSEKRFAEDLVEVLRGMGRELSREVDLVLVKLEGGERVELAGVPMTAAKRQRVWEARDRGASSKRTSARIQRVERTHSEALAQEFAFLAEPLSYAGWEGGASLSRAAAQADLDQLEWLVANTYSYRDLRGLDYRAAFDAVRRGLGSSITQGAFATRLAQLLALFGDGHTRVRNVEAYRPRGYLPFLLADVAGGVLALRADRSGYLEPEFPFVESIDGRSIDEWLQLATRTQAAGSPQFVRYHGLRDLRLLNALRLEAGEPLSAELEVVLRNASGEHHPTRLTLASRKPTYGPWPRTDQQLLLDGDIGYLRLPSMDDDPEFIDGLTSAMQRLRATRGLIIDVRGNGGGSRDALRTLLPYFLDPEGGPRVINVGAYRWLPGEQRGRAEGYMENRFLYPLTSKRWSVAERAVIERVATDFEPDWTPDPAAFSAWHYFVISPGGEFHYDKPVVILCDSGCFSATDIFLGAFADATDVTLMGTPSGGGSGRSQGSSLANSMVSLRLSSMASFRVDGARYDGVGVTPDVTLQVQPSDLLEGGGDSVLEAALEFLR